MTARDVFIRGCALVGVLMVLAGELFYWNDAIVYPGYRAMGLPIFYHAVFPPPTVYPISYGVFTLLLLGVAYVAVRVRRPLTLAWCAFFLLLLGLQCPLQIAFSQPTWLDQYWESHLQYSALISFAESHNLPDVAPVPASSVLIGIDSLYDRVFVTLISLKIGWTFHVVGSLLLLIGALGYVGKWDLIRPHVLGAVCLLAALFVLNTAGAFAGETCWQLGLKAERAQDLDAAKSYYRWSMALDQWNKLSNRVFDRLGVIAEMQGHLNLPEYYFHEGVHDTEVYHPEQALNEFTAAMSTKDKWLARQARMQYASLSSFVATNVYQSGTPGAAAAYWERAASMRKSNVGDHYLAARGQQDSSAYNQALRSLAKAQGNTGDLLLQTQLYSSLGDVYSLRKDVPMGRLQYLQSLFIIQNFVYFKDMRAQKALTDDLQR